MNLKNIAIIGAGQLGSRHLQALAKVNEEVVLYIVDPIEMSLEISKERFNKVNTLGKNLMCLNHTTDLPKELEFVVVSTNSKQRLTVLQELLNHAQVKYLLLEKFLFPTIQEYEQATRILETKDTSVYVNCARTMWPAYQKLKIKMEKSSSITYEVVGVNWNLASNAIHFLNLFLYLLNESEVTIDTSMLDYEPLKSKREGYIEFSGTLTAVTPSQHKLILTSNLVGDSSTMIRIKSDTQVIEINELNQIISINGDKETFNMHHQSNLTNQVYEQLIKTGNCSLVTYQQSAKEHIMLLHAFQEFLGDRNGAIT